MRVRPRPSIAGGGDDDGDEGKTRADIGWHAPANDQEEDQRADARK
jgi:hypothetical protein